MMTDLRSDIRQAIAEDREEILAFLEELVSRSTTAVTM